MVRSAAAGGARSGLAATWGVVVGCLVWGALAVAGLAALFTASPVLYEVVRIAGAVYLVWMAARLIGRRLGRSARAGEPAPGSAGRRAFRQGLLTNLLNPKIAAFYVGVLPVLVPPGFAPAPTMAALVLVHALLGLMWLGLTSWLIARGRGVLGRPVVQRWLDRVAGVVLLGFAGRLALDAA